jgi:hypothetical protein
MPLFQNLLSSLAKIASDEGEIIPSLQSSIDLNCPVMCILLETLSGTKS